ncbi:MAG: aminopeptidase P N-terminal domain-containing protein [Cytophagales bacterium]
MKRHQDPDNNSLFCLNRNKLVAKMPTKSLAIVSGNDTFPTNGDGTMPHKASSDLFYLTGIVQEETILVLFPDHFEQNFREVLFIRFTDEHTLTWEGKKLNKEEAKKTSGIQSVFWTHEFDQVLHQIVFEADVILLNTNEHVRNSIFIPTKDLRLLESLKSKYPLHIYGRLSPILADLRLLKSEAEILWVNKAIEITHKAFLRTLKNIKPGMFEYEVEAEIIYEFIKNGSNGHAYSPIIAGGANACVLHYNENNQVLKSGELLLMDFGAEYACYNADLTRTVPVNGTFTKRQKEVYQAVLNIQKFAISLIRKGKSFKAYNEEIVQKTEEELFHLGLLSKEEISTAASPKTAYKKFFMHGISHFLGLDVHDVGSRNVDFQPGMLLTVEPGIYIKEEGIGIRLENNILVTEDGNQDLMASIPIEIEELEELMNVEDN